MPLNRSWIEAHIPHQGRMCLLDEVLDWTAERIRCCVRSHRSADHPLRSHGRLGISCGVELAAQAMAAHGSLIAEACATKPAGGLLASVRGVHMHVSRLDDVQTDLICDAVLIAGDGRTALYEFELHSCERPLMSGRATVVFDSGA